MSRLRQIVGVKSSKKPVNIGSKKQDKIRKRSMRAVPAKIKESKRGDIEKTIESEFVREVRGKIKLILDNAVEGKPDNVIGLMLAIVNQETGNYDAANYIIDEYKLDELFGIKKF